MNGLTVLLRFALALAGLIPALHAGSGPAFATLDRASRDMVFQSTVQIGQLLQESSGGRMWTTIGSGSVISPQGLVLTNHHVIDETAERSREAVIPEGYSRIPGEFIILVSDGRNPPELQFFASVAADDADLDLAVLRIDRDRNQSPVDPAALNLPYLRLGSTRDIDIGDPVHVAGFPAIGSGSLTYTEGIVSGFLYEDGFDGPAWINTDAVMSGGVSGGVAVDQAGLLIGVPTSGTPLDCRPGDTNGDGEENEQDIGCVPTGGSLGQLRPIDLALPLLRSVDPDLAPGPAPDPAAAAPAPVTDVATAAACASRGDWRCASRIYRLAWEANPGDPEVATAFYDALLGLGRVEEDGAQLGAARAAYAEAAAIDPSRPEAAAAESRLQPYTTIRYADGFTEPNYATNDDTDRAAQYTDGALQMTVRTPGHISTFPLGDQALPSGNVAFTLDVASTSGGGGAVLSLGDWLIIADPQTTRWSILQLDPAANLFTQWLAPADYSAIAGPGLARMEVRVIGGTATLLINGIDVSTTQGIALPAFAPDAPLGFGATMSFESAEPFTVALDRVAVYDLP
jgi:hypothetical protein